jgi:hypothetical protein
MNLEDHLFALEESFWTEGAGHFRGARSSAYVRDGAAWKLAFHQQTLVR